MEVKKKVLLVSPLGENLTGGIISWTKNIINYYQDSAKEVELSLLDSSSNEQVLTGDGLFKRIRVGLKNYLPLYKEYKKELKRNKYDAIHICTSASLGLVRDLLLANASKNNGAKTIVHMHFGRIPVIMKTKGWERKLLLKLLGIIDCVVVMDHGSFNSLKEYGFENVFYLPNPFSSEVLDEIESKREIKRIPRKIVYAGHVLETKGVFELVEACRGIKDIKLEIIGKITNNTIREKLITIAGDDYENWLTITGNKPHEIVITEMLSCSVFVLPSYTEGFPNVILESMACGCPIVSTTVGAIPEMLNFDSASACGICVAPKDVKGLRVAINRMLEDQDFAHYCADNAKKRVKQLYSMPIVWNQLVGIWKHT